MAQFPVVKGVRARFTKINSCGRPIAGPANRLVTSGFVSVNLSPVMKDAEAVVELLLADAAVVGQGHRLTSFTGPRSAAHCRPSPSSRITAAWE